MRLILVHYHLRPGGVRRVLELAAPFVARRLAPNLSQVLVATGEAPDPAWWRRWVRAFDPTRVSCLVDPALGYLSVPSRSSSRLRQRLEACWEAILGAGTPEDLVWAHNLSLGRNLPLARALIRACERHGVRLVLHHHDWWFDQRWARWPEMRAAGFGSLNTVARTLFATGPRTRHAAINRQESALLHRHFPGASAWMPNPVTRGPAPSVSRLDAARRWLQRQCGGRPGPVWLLPCRLLRRKNIAEALLLTRWVRPDARLITTAGVSSEAEAGYARHLHSAAQTHGWPLTLGALENAGPTAPSVSELMAACEVVLLTSLQEGFGLPYLEAAAAGRPLICRRLPNVAPDLARLGFRFPQSYQEVRVATRLLDWPAEQARQSALFQHWRRALPLAARRLVPTPAWLRPGPPVAAVPFSRLTFTAQVEVLARPVDESWMASLPFNRFLDRWRRRAAAGRLQPSPWPAQANASLGEDAYAQRLLALATAPAPRPFAPDASSHAQGDFLRLKLGSDGLFPLLWREDPA